MAEVQSGTNRPVPPPEAFSEIIERPLFMENRRPFVPAPNKKRERPGPVEPDISAQISLSAIAITDDKRIALIENNRDRKLKKTQAG